MAVDGAKGLFRVMDPNGSILYTRNGQFFPNKEGFIVNAQGYRLTGYEEGGTNIIPIRVPTGNIAPLATTTIGTKVNLDANESVVPDTNIAEVIGTVVLDDGVGTTTHYYTISGGALTWTNNDGTTVPAVTPPADEIGRASCRERVCQYV